MEIDKRNNEKQMTLNFLGKFGEIEYSNGPKEMGETHIEAILQGVRHTKTNHTR